MATIKIKPFSPSLFLQNPKPFLNSQLQFNQSLSIKTLNLSPLKPYSHHFPQKPYLPIIKSSLISNPQIFNPNPSISSIISTIIAVSKRLITLIRSFSLHELHVPIRALATGVGKWLDLYNSVLMVRVLLSWFPNMPWELQPFSAIRDLCDPYLSFFRKILPPVGKMDISPVLAFMVLGVLSAILNNSGATC